MDLDKLYDDVLGRMLKAGWLRNYRLTKGKGWHLGLELAGKERLQGLKMIASSHGLLTDDRAPVAFCVLSQGLSLDEVAGVLVGEKPDSFLLSFVAECLDMLSLRADRDGDLCLVLFHIADGWG